MLGTTLHATFGTVPSDSSHRRDGHLDIGPRSGLNERISFGDDNDSVDGPSASAVFRVYPDRHPNEKVFVPPYFVPPGQQSIEQHRVFENHVGRQPLLSRLNQVIETVAQAPNLALAASSNQYELRQLAPRVQENPIDTSTPPLLPTTPHEDIETQELGHPSPASSPHSEDIERARAANWSNSARQAFHAMIYAPGYVNRYRLTPAKYHRILSYLQNPDVQPLCEDGTKDHQTRYQAAQWVLRDGKLYRKSEKKDGSGGLRSHLDLDETWEVVTAEHVRSGHLGRDRLRKALERNFIGYTLQEIMFILRECKTCNGHGKATAAPQLETPAPTPVVPVATEHHDLVNRVPRASSKKTQSSNFMWF